MVGGYDMMKNVRIVEDELLIDPRHMYRVTESMG